jgi:hypothetical protein
MIFKASVWKPARHIASTLLLAVLFIGTVGALRDLSQTRTFLPDDKRFEYVGRIDFSNPDLPRFWSPGVYITAKFAGSNCAVLLNDQVLWGSSHNYVEVVVDGDAKRYHLNGFSNVIQVNGLTDGPHTLVVCKDTESGIGYLEFVGLQCQELLIPDPLPKRKMEFVGDSITAGAGTDISDSPCGQPNWYGQHNNYESYGPKTARLLNAQWMVSAVSGIGLIHSCCNMSFTMPDVYDKIANRPSSDNFAASTNWDFSRYQPDIVTVCLGQNDGPANQNQFVAAYESFVEHLRFVHPMAQIVLITSPMGNTQLITFMKTNLTTIAQHENAAGDNKVSTFFFSRSWNDGCGGHPSMENDTEVAGELANYLKTILRP